MKFLKENFNPILLISFFSIVSQLFVFDYGFINGKFYFSINPISIYQWPLIDNFPALLRLKNSNFLKYDFFTNASSTINPRFFYVKTIHYFSYIFKIDFIKTLISFCLFFTITIPVLFYFLILKITSKILIPLKINTNKTIVFLFIILIFNTKLNQAFSIAWWLPFLTLPIAQTFSLFFGLLNILLNDKKTIKNVILCHFFLIVSILFHPSIGLLCFIFNIIINYESFYSILKNNKYYFINVILIILLINFIFGSSTKLSSENFVRIYCLVGHSQHYLLNFFGNHLNISWKINFMIIQFLLIFPSVLFYQIKNKRLIYLSFIFYFSYILSVFSQFLFTDLFPSKIVASIAPIRFSMFAYWLVAIIWTTLISLYLSKLKQNVNILKHLRINSFLLTFLITFTSFTYINMNNPFKQKINERNSFYKYINSTNKNSVFISENDMDNINIPILCNRAVFIGNGFPFKEDFFKEYAYRSKLIYGSFKALSNFNIDIQKRLFFLKISPKQFKKIKKIRKIDYVILNNSSKHKFHNSIPVFKDNLISIYKI